MIKSKEISDPSSCLNRSEDDEMVFVLCARDPVAPDLVRIWANCRDGNGGKPEKVQEARECADAMERWRAEREKHDDSAAPSGDPQPEVRGSSEPGPGDDDASSV
jgi:hypothetical protein